MDAVYFWFILQHEAVLKWIVVIATQLSECTKNLQLGHFKCFNVKNVNYIPIVLFSK